MTIRSIVRTWRTRRKFARVLATYGIRPTRHQLDLVVRWFEPKGK